MSSEKQLHIIRHALGLREDGKGRAYRNHFVTGPGSTDYDDCCALVAAGLMTRRAGSVLTGGDPCFVVTPAGVVVAAPTPPSEKGDGNAD